MISESALLQRAIGKKLMTHKVLADLRTKITFVKDQMVRKEIERLTEENEALAKECEHQRQLLIKAEIRNGKPQYVGPTQPPSTVHSTASESTPISASGAGSDAAQTTKAQSKPQEGKDKIAKKPKVQEALINETPKVEDVVCVSQLDLRVGLITNIEKHPDADALYLEQIDVGEPKPRTVISGLVRFVPLEEMRNRLVVVMCNLKPAKMRGIVSEGMVMCASTADEVEPIRPPKTAVPGDKITWTGLPAQDYPNPEAVLNPKKKIWDRIAPDFKVNGKGETVWMSKQLEVRGKGLITADSLRNVQVR